MWNARKMFRIWTGSAPHSQLPHDEIPPALFTPLFAIARVSDGAHMSSNSVWMPKSFVFRQLCRPDESRLCPPCRAPLRLHPMMKHLQYEHRPAPDQVLLDIADYVLSYDMTAPCTGHSPLMLPRHSRLRSGIADYPVVPGPGSNRRRHTGTERRQSPRHQVSAGPRSGRIQHRNNDFAG